MLSWIDEKEQVLKSITIPDGIEDMSLVQHKFEGLLFLYEFSRLFLNFTLRRI